MRIPTIRANMQMIKTPPAAMSLMRSILGLCAVEYRSHKSSMEVLSDSAPSTSALIKRMGSHS